MKKRIVTIVGARPQFIKAAPLSKALKEHPEIEEILVHTGQHFDANMSDIFFSELHIPKPKYSLNINDAPHGQMTGHMLGSIEELLTQEPTDAVVVYGDTNSTLAGSLAASKLQIPVIHIEAGLRSYNRKMPEETNRVLTDHVSSLLLCPTKTAVSNLQKEGITGGSHHVGDIMYDATLHAIERIQTDNNLNQKFQDLEDKFALMTVHRAESTDSFDTFEKIIQFAKKFATDHALKIIFPVHPRTKTLVNQLPKNIKEKFILLDPLSYLDTQFLLSKAEYVLTDSGGLQKEAYFHRVPCITLRSETEWVETIESGWNRLWTTEYYHQRTDIKDFGDGQSAKKMAEIIVDFLQT
ncbi:MAG: UDP-N-acetylglucosamine 2-epimerase (non-hydrolyzing) [Pseudomonadota bacterium]